MTSIIRAAPAQPNRGILFGNIMRPRWLDIAFIASDLRVVKTCTMPVEPYGFEEKTYPSEFPAQYALEVAAGQLAAAGVKVGDKVEFSPGVPPAAKAAPGP